MQRFPIESPLLESFVSGVRECIQVETQDIEPAGVFFLQRLDLEQFVFYAGGVVRPETRPFTVLGRPVSSRKHKQNIEPNGHRWARYHIKRSQLTCNGPYSVQVNLVAGMVPVNLVQTISSVGFDYDMSTRDVAEMVQRIETAMQAPPESEEGLEGLDLDPSLLRALTEYEEHRLRENLQRGRHLSLVDSTFEIIAFEDFGEPRRGVA